MMEVFSAGRHRRLRQADRLCQSSILVLRVFAFAGLIVIVTAADAVIEPREIWNEPWPGERARSNERLGGTAEGRHSRLPQLSLSRYLRCARPMTVRAAAPRLHHRKPNSLTRSLALVVTAAVLYIPANVFPVMTVISFGKGEADTIMSGVKAFIAADMWPLAILVFFASVTVPMLKLVRPQLSGPLAEVSLACGGRATAPSLYRVIEVVGRWSMIDVFMISILIALGEARQHRHHRAWA